MSCTGYHTCPLLQSPFPSLLDSLASEVVALSSLPIHAPSPMIYFQLGRRISLRHQKWPHLPAWPPPEADLLWNWYTLPVTRYLSSIL